MSVINVKYVMASSIVVALGKFEFVVVVVFVVIVVSLEAAVDMEYGFYNTGMCMCL